MTTIYLDRRAWGATSLPRLGHVIDRDRFRGVVVHHTVMDAPPPGNLAAITAYMRRLQRVRPDLGLDVPYSFVVFQGRNLDDAIICEGRGFTRTGAHTAGLNSSRYGVAYGADTREDPVTPGMEAAVRWVLAHITDPVATTGHKDHKATACPGPAGVASLPNVQPGTPPPDELEESDMETLHDTSTGAGWVCANGKARPLSDVPAWLASYTGPVRSSPSMRYVVPDLYDIVTT